MSRILAIPPWVADVALAGLLVLLPINLGVAGTHPASLGDTLLLTAGAATVAVRRRWPLAVLAATLVPYVVVADTNPGLPAVIVALYTVASLCSQRTALVATAVAAAASVLAVVGHGDDGGLAVARALEVVAAAVVGLVVAERRRQRDREAKMRSQIAAADERVRIARELHDVVAHDLSVIVVQANVVGEAVKADDPAFVPAQAVVAAGREALADMRRVLGVLRTTEEPGDGRAPQPGLADLNQLLERVRATGLDVEVSIEGEAGAVPAGVGLCAYRIVQEALTNVMRHAQASRARVDLQYTTRSLRLEITDDGVGPNHRGSADAGHGIDGMRERATLFGGKLDAGPNPGRGFRVRAELPV